MTGENAIALICNSFCFLLRFNFCRLCFHFHKWPVPHYKSSQESRCAPPVSHAMGIMNITAIFDNLLHLWYQVYELEVLVTRNQTQLMMQRSFVFRNLTGSLQNQYEGWKPTMRKTGQSQG